MSGNVAGFVGNIPDEYDRGLGPVIFVDYATIMARRAASFSPMRVLETAAGTGIVTRRLRDLLPVGAHVTMTDLNPPMLDIARGKFGSDELVEFRPADATGLPFPDQMFDAVICQFGLMFFPDSNKAHHEVFRVLASDGRYLFSVWDSHRYNPFGRIAQETPADFFPADPPQFYKVPFSCHEIDPIKKALIDTGFTDIRIDVITLEKELTDPEALARGLVYGNPLIEQIRTRGGVDSDQVVAAVIKALRQAFPAGSMPLQAIFFDARKP